MKREALYVILILLLLGAFGGYLFYANKKKDELNAEKEKEKEPAPPANAPPVQPVSQETKTYFVDQGEGQVAVKNRMKTIFDSADFEAIKNAEINKLFEGLSYSRAFKGAMVGQFGSASKIPVIPNFIDSSFSSDFEGIESMQGFEAMTAGGGGFNGALLAWQSAANIQGYDYWPYNLQQLIWSGEFGAWSTRSADKNASERYDAFTTDFKKFSANMVKLCNDLTKTIERRAIQDLLTAGWKFSGQTLGT